MVSHTCTQPPKKVGRGPKGRHAPPTGASSHVCIPFFSQFLQTLTHQMREIKIIIHFLNVYLMKSTIDIFSTKGWTTLKTKGYENIWRVMETTTGINLMYNINNALYFLSNIRIKNPKKCQHVCCLYTCCIITRIFYKLELTLWEKFKQCVNTWQIIMH